MTTPNEVGAAWVLKIRSFAGLVPGASHYMVSIHGATEDVEIVYRMTPAEARKLSTHDFTERPGTVSARFLAEPPAQEAAITAFLHLCGPRDVLVSEYTPGAVLAGQVDLVAEGQALADDEDGWYGFLDRFRPHVRPTMYGKGAPPSPRRDIEAVVEHEGDGWKVEKVR
jgi:hypothetical protein